MVIGEDVAAALWIVGEEDGGTSPALSLLFHLSQSTISLWLAELIMEKWGNGTLEIHLRLSVKIR